jgi:hypothetical protein
MKVTQPMQLALDWLSERGGQAIIDRYGRLVASGDVRAQSDASTWLRLVAAGKVTGQGGRLYLASETDK